MPNNLELKAQINNHLRLFLDGNLKENSLSFLKTLGYESNKQISLEPNTPEGFKAFLKTNGTQFYNEPKAHLNEWQTVDFLFQLTDEEISRSKGLFDSNSVDISDVRIESYIFLAVKLNKSEYKRSELAEITREINRTFPMPVMILFQHGNTLTFSIIDRRLNKRDELKDVLQKVTLIKDIRLENPHRAHIEILSDLALENLDAKNFVELHKAWKKVLDTKELNKKFFQELANWYFWAVENVVFPADEEKNKEVRNATSVIRLITRLMFVWFLKEKGLVSERLFDEKYLETILKFQNDSAYYKAILQNLFFATLNSEMGKREFVTKERFQGKSKHYGVYNVFRYEKEFRKPNETIKELFEPTPFLNGGLFECLDKPKSADGTQCEVRIDGFSDSTKNVLQVPDKLFFSEENFVDLSKVYDDKKKANIKVRGLINILNSYKFTIAENTPIEEEIALDPELLGKVFENLLASYNPETKTTARKQTGSFYTPREIVNYMVDESLLVYLKTKLQTETEGFSGYVAFGESQPTMFGNEMRLQPKFETPVSNNRWHGKDQDLETALRDLFDYTETTNNFNELETEILIKAIDNCKILDPACGSGAFPMGILHRLVHLLKKLDKDNEKWREWQRQKAIKDTEEAYKIGDHKERDERLKESSDVFENNASDYGRKLFLIENCIYGVDIQPIAIQIAKLRFFISLIVDEKANDDYSNNRGIRPLPNLETKFVAGNTLIGLEVSGGLKPTEVADLEQELKEVRVKHFGARYRRKKEFYRQEDKRIRAQIAELLTQSGFPSTSADQIAAWNPYDQNASANWFDAEYMFGIEKGFDIVIGNPPYLRVQGIRDIYPSLANDLVRIYRSATGSFDLYATFLEKGLTLINRRGIVNYIMPVKWTNAAFGSGLRQIVSENKSAHKIISFGAYQVFNASTYTGLQWFKLNSNDLLYLELDKDLTSNYELGEYLTTLTEKNGTVIPNSKLTKNSWVLTVGKTTEILNKLNKQPRRLSDIFEKIFQGLATSKDDVYFLYDCVAEEKYISGFSKQLNKNVKIERDFTKPLLKGEDVHRYDFIQTDRAVIFPYKLVNGEAFLYKEEEIKSKFPLVYSYLKQCEDVLRGREKGRFNIDGEWFQFGRKQGINSAEKEKLLAPEISLGGNFAYDEKGEFYSSTTIYGYIKKADIKESYKALILLPDKTK